MSEQNFNSLADFTEKARKNRKYADNTAAGFKAALRLFDAELNEDERGSLGVFEANFDRIYQSVCSKNEKKFTAASLETYRRRVKRVFSDYKKYGLDTSKLASWNPPMRKRAKKTTNISSSKNSIERREIEQAPEIRNVVNSFKLEIPLKNNEKALIILPKDITIQEVTMIKGILDNIVPTVAE